MIDRPRLLGERPAADPDAPPVDPAVCLCCGERQNVRRDLAPWWTPSPGTAYGPAQTISLCEHCIHTLQWFVELRLVK